MEISEQSITFQKNPVQIVAPIAFVGVARFAKKPEKYVQEHEWKPLQQTSEA